MARSYNESHEWAEIDGDVVVVGLSDFAVGEVGEVIHVELPQVGDRLPVVRPLLKLNRLSRLMTATPRHW